MHKVDRRKHAGLLHDRNHSLGSSDWLLLAKISLAFETSDRPHLPLASFVSISGLLQCPSSTKLRPLWDSHRYRVRQHKSTDTSWIWAGRDHWMEISRMCAPARELQHLEGLLFSGDLFHEAKFQGPHSSWSTRHAHLVALNLSHAMCEFEFGGVYTLFAKQDSGSYVSFFLKFWWRSCVC